ncbi:TrmH family RNA methyltransferase [Patescibacteria group bacterium]|nr:TrmH family RNA methyltransferase [Patescibacteria group bacterium]MCG2696383.1 TrmH family RNA methyltransferase [Candidatus Portnoybacteria bacterium]
MIRLIFDCLRAPYDLANILQVALATGKCEIHITGNSLRHDHRKVLGKVGSWSKRVREHGLPNLAIQYWPTLEDCVQTLKAQGIRLIGTSPHAKKSFYELDLSTDNYAFVFGTESSGLSREKAELLDEMVNIPMSSDIDFMTLSVVVPIVVYEAIRQKG